MLIDIGRCNGTGLESVKVEVGKAWGVRTDLSLSAEGCGGGMEGHGLEQREKEEWERNSPDGRRGSRYFLKDGQREVRERKER